MHTHSIPTNRFSGTKSVSKLSISRPVIRIIMCRSAAEGACTENRQGANAMAKSPDFDLERDEPIGDAVQSHIHSRNGVLGDDLQQLESPIEEETVVTWQCFNVSHEALRILLF
jgi:hypothetical protein